MIRHNIVIHKVRVLVILPIFNSAGVRVHASHVYEFPDIPTAESFARMFRYIPEYYIKIVSASTLSPSNFKGFRLSDGTFVDSFSVFRFSLI